MPVNFIVLTPANFIIVDVSELWDCECQCVHRASPAIKVPQAFSNSLPHPPPPAAFRASTIQNIVDVQHFPVSVHQQL
jgi:hypothetical protein